MVVLRRLLLTFIATIVLLVLVLAGWYYFGPDRLPNEQQVAEVIAQHRAKLDYVVPLAEVDVAVAEGMDTTEVSQMPELVLALPEQAWFETQVLRIIGHELGLTNKASVENQGTHYIWQEGNKYLTTNPTIGLIRFSTAFNLADVVLPEALPKPDMARAILDKFFAQTGLPTNFYDLENLTPTYMDLDGDGIPAPAADQTGQLLKLEIPYIVSGVPVFLPIPSYIVVDGDGVIRLFALLTPNLRQTDEVLTLSGVEHARAQLQAGVGVVIDAAFDPVYGSSNLSNQLLIERAFPAYYINNREFYALGTRRVLTAVYVFGGEKGKVAVIAE